MKHFTTTIFHSVLIAACSLFSFASLSQGFYDGFESGTYSPTWTPTGGTYTWAVPSTGSVVGTYHLQQSGSGSHFQGLKTSFAPVQSPSVSYYVRSNSISSANGYFVIGPANLTDANSSIVFAYLTNNSIRFYANGTYNFNHPITVDTWVHVELLNFDWVNKNFDVYIDGALIYADFPFRNPAATDIEEIHLYNLNATDAKYDEINVAPQCTTFGATAVAASGPHNFYLDASGSVTIDPTDVDGGSFVECGNATLSLSDSTFGCGDISNGGVTEALVISGVVDAQLTGGIPKAVEFYALDNISDLSVYGFGSANNGGGTDGEEFTFPAVSVNAGDYIYVTTDSTSFADFFGFDADYIDGNAPNINGDDAIELFMNGSVIDVFGDINLDGTGQPWEYTDGWAYRVDNTGPDGTTFNIANWSFSGIDALDGALTNATAGSPVPVGTYTGSVGGQTTTTLYVEDNFGNIDSVSVVVNIMDTIAPTASNPASEMVVCNSDIPAPDVNVVTDAADNCSSTVTWVNDVSDGLTCPETITRTYNVADASGNSIDVTQQFVVNDTLAPMPDSLALPDVTSDCPVTLVAPTAVDNCGGTVTVTPDVTFPISALGLTTVTWTYEDACGNATTQTQDVTITQMDVSTSTSGITITANMTGATYQWIDCSNNMPVNGETNQSFTATANGDYAVIINNGQCSDTSACVTIDEVSVQELTGAQALLYPNPTEGSQVKIESANVLKSVTVTDMTGREVEVTVDLNSRTLNVANLAPGNYTVIVVTEDSDESVLSLVVSK